MPHFAPFVVLLCGNIAELLVCCFGVEFIIYRALISWSDELDGWFWEWHLGSRFLTSWNWNRGVLRRIILMAQIRKVYSIGNQG